MIYVDTLEEKLSDANFEPISKSLVVCVLSYKDVSPDPPILSSIFGYLNPFPSLP